MTPDYAGLAPIAQRTGRRTVIVDLPGTGHSVPSLDCSDAEALGEVGADSVAFLEAVDTCRERLLAEGVDPGLMTPRRSAAVLLAVMDAVGSERWVVMGHGTTGVTAVQVAREHPERVEALVLDSAVHVHRGGRRDVRPWCGGSPPPAVTTTGVLVATGTSPSCGVRPGNGPGRVRSTWVRRSWIASSSTGPFAGWWRPSRPGRLRCPPCSTRQQRGGADPSCSGSRRHWRSLRPCAWGCCPSVRPASRSSSGRCSRSVCPAAARRAPYVEACARWGIAERADEAAPVVGIPTLVLHGELDPFATRGRGRRPRCGDGWPARTWWWRGAGGTTCWGTSASGPCATTGSPGRSTERPALPACVDDDIDFP